MVTFWMGADRAAASRAVLSRDAMTMRDPSGLKAADKHVVPPRCLSAAED
jgi:hypothetical protein